jgi:hypothetical protein
MLRDVLLQTPGDKCDLFHRGYRPAAFSVFFMHSPSLLTYQRHLQEDHGQSNCESLFGLTKILSGNHIRDMLGPPCRNCYTRCLARCCRTGAIGWTLRVPPARQSYVDHPGWHRVFPRRYDQLTAVLEAAAWQRQDPILSCHAGTEPAPAKAGLVAPGHNSRTRR